MTPQPATRPPLTPEQQARKDIAIAEAAAIYAEWADSQPDYDTEAAAS